MADITYLPCKQEHIRLIAPQEGDRVNQLMYTMPDYAEILSENFSMTAFVGHKPIACGGLIHVSKYRAIVWSLMGKDTGAYMLQLTRRVRQFLDQQTIPRIEMTVDFDFLEGHKWARLLGFEMEAARMRKHGILGNDETLYARINQG